MKQEAAARREEVERLEQEAEANRNAPVDDSKIVEQMFGFLPEQAQMAEDGEKAIAGKPTFTHSHTCNISNAFASREASNPSSFSHAGMGSIPLPAEEEDLSEYKFSKFAATYFQGQATPTYIKRQLPTPLLGLKTQQDRVVRYLA